MAFEDKPLLYSINVEKCLQLNQFRQISIYCKILTKYFPNSKGYYTCMFLFCSKVPHQIFLILNNALFCNSQLRKCV